MHSVSGVVGICSLPTSRQWNMCSQAGNIIIKATVVSIVLEVQAVTALPLNRIVQGEIVCMISLACK